MSSLEQPSYIRVDRLKSSLVMFSFTNKVLLLNVVQNKLLLKITSDNLSVLYGALSNNRLVVTHKKDIFLFPARHNFSWFKIEDSCGGNG